MQIVHRAISTDIIHRAGYLKKQATTGAVTYIQRFGSALNLNIHLHILFLEGVIMNKQGETKFERCKAPSHSDLETVVNTISQRIANYLEQAGLIQRDITVCEACEKTNVKIIACITVPAVIHKLLAYLDKQIFPYADNPYILPEVDGLVAD